MPSQTQVEQSVLASEVKSVGIGGVPGSIPDTGKPLAPPPIIDKYPIIIGQNLSLQYLSSVYRLCTTGIRYQYVDALNELLEHDPHARGVVRQRILALAGARVELTPADLPKDDPDKKLALEIKDECSRQIANIPSLAQALGRLAWGTIYGVSGAENDWDRCVDSKVRWEIRGIRFIHSRRLNYPDPMSWDVRVWDQGYIGGGYEPFGKTGGVYGLRCADYPGKFIVHTPALSGDYPTRDGEGRYIGFYLALKRMVVRCSAQDFERTVRPWVVGYFNRDSDETGKDPVADDNDISALDRTLDALGTGSMNAAALPNSVKIEVLRAASQLNAREFADFLDAQITKALLGQTFTTSPGAHGNRSAGETAKDGTLEILRYDAACLADSLERDLVKWIVHYNWGPLIARRLTPKVALRIDEKPDAQKRAAVAKLLSEQDVPLDADDLAEQCGYQVVPKPEGDDTPRRTRLVLRGGVEPSRAEEEPDGEAPTGGDTDTPAGQTPVDTPATAPGAGKQPTEAPQGGSA